MIAIINLMASLLIVNRLAQYLTAFIWQTCGWAIKTVTVAATEIGVATSTAAPSLLIGDTLAKTNNDDNRWDPYPIT